MGWYFSCVQQLLVKSEQLYGAGESEDLMEERDLGWENLQQNCVVGSTNS